MGALPVSKKERCREGKTGIGPRMKCGHATHRAKNGLPSLKKADVYYYTCTYQLVPVHMRLTLNRTYNFFTLLFNLELFTNFLV